MQLLPDTTAPARDRRFNQRGSGRAICCCGGGGSCYPKPRSIRESHPQLGELLRISIPAFGCFGGRIHSRLDGLGALGCYSLDQPLLVGGVCLRPFVSGDQLGMGNVLIHRGFPLAKVPFSAHFPGPPRTGKATR